MRETPEVMLMSRLIGIAAWSGLCALLVLPAGCSRNEQDGKRTDTGRTEDVRPAADETVVAAAQPAEKDPNLERLVSLPYVDWSDEIAEPSESGATVYEAEQVCPGYRLYNIAGTCELVLLDESFTEVHRWSLAAAGFADNCRFWSRGTLLPDGDVIIVGAKNIPDQPTWGATMGCYVARLTWAGDVVYCKYMPAHHDFEALPDGRVLTLTERFRSIPEYRTDADVLEGFVTMLSPEAEVVDELSLYDLWMNSPDVLPVLQDVPIAEWGHGPIVDTFHPNTVEWLKPEPELAAQHGLYRGDKVLVTVRFQDMVVIADWNTKKAVWGWGRGELDCPHGGTLVPGGNILIFDNGRGRRWSRVVEVDPRTDKIVWQYQAEERGEFFSSGGGSNSRLPNGNTLIVESHKGRVFEVVPDGEIVWEFLCPVLNEEGKRAGIGWMDLYDAAFIETLRARHAQ